MPQVRQAIIAAGGKGFRLGSLANTYGNKSLVKIQGKTILEFTVEALLKAGVTEAIVSIDNEENYEKACKAFKGKRRVKVVQDQGTGNTAQLPLAFDYLLKEKFWFIYGNTPPLVSHLKAMNAAFNKADAIVSYFPFSTSRYPLIAELDGNQAKNLKYSRDSLSKEAFVEPPFLLRNDILPFIQKHEEWYKILPAYCQEGNKIIGVPSLMPPNVHYPHEISLLLSHLLKYAGTDYRLNEL